MEGLDLSKLPIDLILNILNIVLLFFVTKKLVYKPVKKFLDARNARVTAAKADAENAKLEAEKSKAEYDEKIADISSESEKIKAEMSDEAKAEAAALIDNAKNEAKKIIAEAKAAGEAERQKTVAKAKDDITELAFGISEKIIGRSVTDEDNKKLAEAFFKN